MSTNQNLFGHLKFESNLWNICLSMQRQAVNTFLSLWVPDLIISLHYTAFECLYIWTPSGSVIGDSWLAFMWSKYMYMYQAWKKQWLVIELARSPNWPCWVKILQFKVEIGPFQWKFYKFREEETIWVDIIDFVLTWLDCAKIQNIQCWNSSIHSHLVTASPKYQQKWFAVPWGSTVS